ncbi:uncharacterized protein SETTUDRAFT_20051 [Exserohilum turcica Et28A]|uniref:PQ loop repeat protein n=1 Tax=Exserohilum turcicum (strain 28A) TaxID=671987 RepID=R0K869_EXST2|nr:uncharacterized protein SETTUDRAFT_20051 [Exserohilum turcica Et28A]EOA84512.1 hypothetical protein SETTUDRAFT_20051 [Exserohilum turcica Et28A]
MDRPQVSIPPAANVLGTLGTDEPNFVQTSANLCFSMVVAGVYRSSHKYGTTGAGRALKACPAPCLSFGGVPFGVYAIVQNFNFALKFQPQAFASLTLIAWGQTLYYHNKWRAWTATVATIALAASFGIMELILILTLRGPYSRGVEWPMMLMAISATIIQVVGLIPPFFELAKRNGRVIGIGMGIVKPLGSEALRLIYLDFWFLTIDYLGAFFSLMAIVAQQWFDALGASLYIVCMLLETGIFASQAIWLWRVRHVRHEAKKAGKTYDEYIAENPCKKLPHSDSSETFVDVEAGHEKRSPSTCTEAPAASENEHTTTTPTDETRTTQEPSPAPLQAPPPALLQPSGPGIIRF